MAPSLRFVRTLNSTTNYNLIDLLRAFTYGTTDLELYSASVTYNKDALVVLYDSTAKRFDVWRCLQNGTTGTWNASKWVKNDVHEHINHSEFSRQMNIVSATTPTSPKNKVWYKIVKTKTSIDPATWTLP